MIRVDLDLGTHGKAIRHTRSFDTQRGAQAWIELQPSQTDVTCRVALPPRRPKVPSLQPRRSKPMGERPSGPRGAVPGPCLDPFR